MLTTLLAIMTLSPVDIPRAPADAMKPWGEAGLPIVAMAGRGPILRPYARFGATARLGWTQEGIAVQVTVTDPTANRAPDVARPYEGDSVELYLGTPGEQNMVQLVVSRTGEKYFDYRKPELRKAVPLAGRSSVSTTPEGYVVRALVAWKTLGLRAEPGLIVGTRVAANDGAGGREREGLVWQNGDFFALSPVRLAEESGTAPQAAIWAAADADLGGYGLNVVADPALAGKKVRFDGRETTLSPDGPRSVAHFDIPVTAGEIAASKSVEVEDEPPQETPLPDLIALRRQSFARGTGAFRAAFPQTVFEGEAFPRFELNDRADAERLVGSVTVETEYYDAAGRKVERATSPGRYGAIVRVASSYGGATIRYQTLFRGTSGVDPVALAAAAEGKPDAEKADRDWWHTLRKRLGTAIQYETYLRFPDESPGKRWPLIVYLHGSGGGDEGAWENTKRYDGPMGYADAHKDFPFATLALRSRGGWYPPAVKDAIDEAVAGGKIDPERIVLCGFSMGAMGTWSVAYDEPDRFAALAIVGGRRGDPAHMALIKDVPVWVFNGEADEATLASDARAAVASFRSAGGKARYTQIPGATHVDSLRIAYSNPELYAWMARQRRKG